MSQNAMLLFTASRIALLATVTSLFLTGCAPMQYYQLHPVSGEVAQLDGRAVTKAAADDVTVVASYEREDMEYIALDVEVKNNTTHALDVDPANFRVYPLTNTHQPLLYKASQQAIHFKQAADPGYEAEHVVVKRKQEEARLKRAKIVNTVLVAAVIVGSVAAASSSSSRNSRDYHHYVNTQNNLNAAFNLVQMKRVIDHGTFADRMQRYDFEAYRWHELALKRGYVAPGESVRGFVYLPKTREATFLKLVYPTTDSSEVALVFQQTLTKNRPR